ncbi:ATP-binding protein [Leptolyngbya sp. KIOST-1]|uniref:ATP-binding protein n=1 Tax=Cyanophyceae TaxID=3028117 RepID=UPI00069069A6|nr:ATP-binding protein [Leptolyngbya sp. KIOST-1]PSR19278.1 ATP-binding protein [filamentous cyanobacterium CCP3]
MAQQQQDSVNEPAKYTMTISRLTVDKLGVKLYDRVSAVIAELVSNSYDADATEVEITAPMGEFLATKPNNQLIDKGYTIEIYDNGIGMTPEEVNNFYLCVGADRRTDSKRGDESREFKRKVMGRKGVGKLAPFGICERIEILTSGGEMVKGEDENGQEVQGYLTAHLILDRSEILQETDSNYEPEVGELDGTVSLKTGTLIKLSKFYKREVPDINILERQLSQRFGISSQDWKIILFDSTKTEDDADYCREVGAFDIITMPDTKITFSEDRNAYRFDGNIFSDLKAGFELNGEFYPITGWAAYSKDPYKDDLMAGIRIYCRGKIAAQTTVFNRGASFSGEYSIRSYLVGEIHADWLDEQEEDLIQTDRRDILWSHELGQEFEQWGLALLKKVGNMSRNPVKKKTWELFKENSNIEERIQQAFPREEQNKIREEAMDFAQLIGQKMREDEVSDPARTEEIVQLSLTFGPHVTLDRKLREAADDTEGTPIAVVAEILKIARIAELSSFGRIADDRVRVINRVETLKDDKQTLEAAFQDLIEQAPWLIDPQWSPITQNQSFTTLKQEFQKYYVENTGEDIQLKDFTDPNKRADFVLSNEENVIQIIEIKRPKHKFENPEMERLNKYVEQMTSFLAEESHKDFTKVFKGFHVTLVCDDEKLTGVYKTAFEGLRKDGTLTYISWTSFLNRTRKMHQDFLNEAERQKRYAAQGS